MIKRLLDIIWAGVGLLIVFPVIGVAMFLIWRQDSHSPFYRAPRVGKGGKLFYMLKLRSMVMNADKNGVNSTSANDTRITPIGHFIRRYKLDELTQFWNVMKGDMSFVGPRPNLKRETEFYTPVERKLLDVRPGITDFSSIVFSDEAEILRDTSDPDVAYNQLIRPGKSLLGLFYVKNHTTMVDVQLLWLTALTIISRTRALAGVQRLLRALGAEPELLKIASRKNPLVPMVPPGGDRIVTSRDGNPFV